MEEDRLYKRTYEKVIQDFTDVGETSSLREKALIKILRTIPEEDYKKLKYEQFIKYQFFIESKDNLGKVHRPEYETKYIFYLSPILEGLEFDRIIAVSAHELAHVVLDHNPSGYIDQQETEAWDRVCKWGFEKEAKYHLELRKGEEVIKIIIRPPSKPFLFPEQKGD